MIISPPFLPVNANPQSDDAWVNSAMTQPTSRLDSTQAPEGSFPLSNKLEWHNGIHLQGTAAGDGRTPVRAIADGKVVYVGEPQKNNNEITDPQNFNPFGEGASWTDNGIIIVEHSTEIGANGNQAVALTYYSVCMHLNEIGRLAGGTGTPPKLKKEDKVWRKDIIGYAGQIYGHAGQVHLEIAMNAENLARLIGREPVWGDPANIPAPMADGRIDAVFGAIWLYLPASTPTRATAPTGHLRGATQSTLGQAMWLKMTYGTGNCIYEAYGNTGNRLGRQEQPNFEYDLYAEANRRHNTLPQTDRNRSSPSGWYELLRFGRNLGRGPNAADKDSLPANAAHWRNIVGPNGQAIWADLNAEGTYKFSDADFLPIQGWTFIDDDSTPNDQRCDSNNLKNLIADSDPDASDRPEPAALARRLGNNDIVAKLRKTVCSFPSEWNQSDITTRYAFVKELPAFKESPDAWTLQEKHFKSLSFADLPAEYLSATWRFHPTEFIATMRKIGWMSLNELGQLVPRAGVLSCVTKWKTAKDRWSDIGVTNFNRVFRKYGLTSANRQTAFLAQVYIETGCLALLSEGDRGEPNPAIPMAQYYAAFYGRGLMQLTWAGTYEDYGKYRGFADHTESYSDNRITANSQHDWAAPTTNNQGQLVRDRRAWSPRFDPGMVASNTFNASDSGAFFWVQKHFTGTSNINRLADQGLTTELIGRMSILVNGGGNGYNERLQYAAFIDRYRGDSVETVQAGTITATRQRINHGQWTTTGHAFTLNVNYTPQRPSNKE